MITILLAIISRAPFSRGGKLMSNSGRTVFQIAEMAVPEKLFAKILACIRFLENAAN